MKKRVMTATVAGAALAGGAILARSSRKRPDEHNSGAAVAYGNGLRLEHSQTIAREPADVYAAWRDLPNLPLVMPNVRSVSENGAESTWTIKGPAARDVSWNARILSDTPERISWRSDEGPVKHAGSVRFRPAPGARGTEVLVEIDVDPPGGAIGRAVAKLTQAPPQRLIEIDLRRFKSVLEAGDVFVNGTDSKE